MSGTSLRARVGKRAGCEAIPILQGALVKTGASPYEVEYTIEKVYRFAFQSGRIASSAYLRFGVDEAIPWLRNVNKEACI
jgi:hypothetical protein